jgi:hypothetical protein
VASCTWLVVVHPLGLQPPGSILQKTYILQCPIIKEDKGWEAVSYLLSNPKWQNFEVDIARIAFHLFEPTQILF